MYAGAYYGRTDGRVPVRVLENTAPVHIVFRSNIIPFMNSRNTILYSLLLITVV